MSRSRTGERYPGWEWDWNLPRIKLLAKPIQEPDDEEEYQNWLYYLRDLERENEQYRQEEVESYGSGSPDGQG